MNYWESSWYQPAGACAYVEVSTETPVQKSELMKLWSYGFCWNIWISYSHPQIDWKVNQHWIDRDLLFHLFGDDYKLVSPSPWTGFGFWVTFFESSRPRIAGRQVCYSSCRYQLRRPSMHSQMPKSCRRLDTAFTSLTEARISSMEVSEHTGTPKWHPFSWDFPLYTIHFGDLHLRKPPYVILTFGRSRLAGVFRLQRCQRFDVIWGHVW